MSYVGNREDDFKDMERFTGKDKEYVIQVRLLARQIIDMLEPRYINTFSRLIEILDEAQRMASVRRFLQDPYKQNVEEKKSYRFFGQNIRDAIRVLRGH